MTNKRQTKRRRRRNRVGLRLLGFLLAAMLVLGIAGLGVWLLWEKRPETTIMTYPVEYEDLIRHYAAENELNPAYVAAVVLAESSYRADAVSSVNAQGLMQLLPSTAEWIAGKMDMDDFTSEMQMAWINSTVSPGLETLFLASEEPYLHVSSSVVRELASYGVNLAGWVPDEIVDDIMEKIERGR